VLELLVVTLLLLLFVCREALQALIPAMLGAQSDAEEGDDSLLQGITRSSFQSIMQDRLSSHVMEVSY